MGVMSGDIDGGLDHRSRRRQVPRLPKGADYAAKQTAGRSLYLGRMLQPMFADIEAAEPRQRGRENLAPNASGRVWQSSENGGVGIADMVMRQMIAIQKEIAMNIEQR